MGTTCMARKSLDTSFMTQPSRNDPGVATVIKAPEEDRVSVTIHHQGKLGLNFGDGGSSWPVVESIAIGGLAARFPELKPVGLLSHLSACLKHTAIGTKEWCHVIAGNAPGVCVWPRRHI